MLSDAIKVLFPFKTKITVIWLLFNENTSDKIPANRIYVMMEYGVSNNYKAETNKKKTLNNKIAKITFSVKKKKTHLLLNP